MLPAGGLKVRSNDCDYVFRPHSAFSHLSGLGADREPDSVLVLEPLDDGGHEAVLFFRPRAGRDTTEFYSDARYGELWVGVRPSLEEVEAELGLTARHLDEPGRRPEQGRRQPAGARRPRRRPAGHRPGRRRSRAGRDVGRRGRGGARRRARRGAERACG
ncbi:hypothetical protein GCM10025868_12410 [Angustibacter aerolatus]|uniref:Aminopeptidase P N-terminal domain-containing protein n=1 Tax=Angustibacter aerolatus TaxID=1162965 RepID=A0ABQ6JCS4_9ACTN|nr:hypothetical protein GCM10025868_12410 [Angustibacter aerolatus]